MAGTSTVVAKSMPIPRGEEQRWFNAAREHRLIYQQCSECGAIADYPRALCPFCWSDEFQENVSAGRGVIYSYTTQHRSGGQGFEQDVPYTLVLVELNEGFRVLANICDCPDDRLAIGLEVDVFFDEVAPNLTLPRFRPSIDEATP